MSSDPDLENQEKQADNYSYISKSLAEVLSNSDDDIKTKKESENISCSFTLNDITLSNLSLISLSLSDDIVSLSTKIHKKYLADIIKSGINKVCIFSQDDIIAEYLQTDYEIEVMADFDTSNIFHVSILCLRK